MGSIPPLHDFTPFYSRAHRGRNRTNCYGSSVPWYIRLVEVSRPLHFGDYGGLPLKILWALFDLVSILVLISGVYLWFPAGDRLSRKL